MFDILSDVKLSLRKNILAAAKSAMENGLLPQAELPDFTVEAPADRSHGDLATNAALVSARALRLPPRKIAEILVSGLESDPRFEKVEIAGAGFINVFLSAVYFGDAVRGVVKSAGDYGRSDAFAGKKINVEFVSANPTGPMHLGNARGGALGDCLAEILREAGAEVTKEFYVNDSGNQIEKFGASLEARYLQHFMGDSVPFPENGYQGADITERAEEYITLHGDSLLASASEERRAALVGYALPLNIQLMKDDLARYRIEYDVWFLESTLHASGAVEKAVDTLKSKGLTFEKDGALWLRGHSEDDGEQAADLPEDESTRDNVLVRANGIPTYFASDIAYHYNKFAVRRFDEAINVWGADHHGHVQRLKDAISDLGLDSGKLDIVLMQLVRLERGGEPVRMSKRTGKAITLTTLLDEIPVDAARFFFNLREPRSHLIFDLDLAAQQSSDNPVYYVQYAHARICSILRALDEENISVPDCAATDLNVFAVPEERELIYKLSELPSLISESARRRDPAMITRYTVDLASLFHRFYNTCRVKDAEPQLRGPRILLCLATRQALANCLGLLKIDAPDRM